MTQSSLKDSFHFLTFIGKISDDFCQKKPELDSWCPTGAKSPICFSVLAPEGANMTPVVANAR